jgi:hypothetical protein
MKYKEDLIKFITENEFITSPTVLKTFEHKLDILLINYKIHIRDESKIELFIKDIGDNSLKYPKMNTKDVVNMLNIIRTQINSVGY